MGIQSVDWDPKEKVYVKRIVKQIIMACGCYNHDTEEYLNECGTEHCPLLKEKISSNTLNGHRLIRLNTGSFDDKES